jgi:ankyrin repeat protein
MSKHHRFAALLLSLVSILGATTPEDLQRIIRQDDLALLEQKATATSVNATDARGNTALHFAAMAGSVKSVKVVLEAGAIVNPVNAAGFTPLILAASSPEKLSLLLAKGADLHARTKAGRSALVVAVACERCVESVQLLLKAGADIKEPVLGGIPPFGTAASSAMVSLLLAHGATFDPKDTARGTPLMTAAAASDVLLLRTLLSKGVDVNASNPEGGKAKNGPLRLDKLAPLILAAPYRSLESMRTLLAAGADVNAQDGRGLTPLMAAVASDRGDARVVKVLIAAGADVNRKDVDGETALDWALKFGDPAVLAYLRAAGAKTGSGVAAPVEKPSPAPNAKAAVDRALPLLLASAVEFFKQSGCVGCHHQAIVSQAVAVARGAGVPVNGHSSLIDVVSRPMEPSLFQMTAPGGGVDNVAAKALGMYADKVAPYSLTDAMVHFIAGKQSGDGSWNAADGLARPPTEHSPITSTALAVRTLQVYGWPARKHEFDAAVMRARAWLLKADPLTTYERAERLLGLYWAGASASELGRAAARLRRDQRDNGGWAQTKNLSADAYATGLAMHALRESGQMRVLDAAYSQGVAYLLSTQMSDGSWYVRSRAPKFQPYFQSGFPHGHHQWISAAATAYAVMALAPASGGPGPTVAVRNRFRR